MQTTLSKFPDQRVKGIMQMSGEIDFRFHLKLKITLVESTYPSQRPECPSLSPHFILVAENCDWSRKIAPLSNLSRVSLLVEWKLTAKAESNCKIYKSWRKCWKHQVSFCHRSSSVSRKAWTLTLQELKKYPRKTCRYSQPRGHLIRVLNERSVNDGGDFCLLWLVILKSAWCSVGDTF